MQVNVASVTYSINITISAKELVAAWQLRAAFKSLVFDHT